MDYKRASELINRYEDIQNKLEDSIKGGSNYQELYNEKVYLSSILRDVVLTGEEIVERGIVGRVHELEKKEKHIEIYKKSIKRLAERYNDRIEELEAEKQDDYEEMINNIKRIVSNKKGSLIDEIRSVLEE